MDYMSIVHELIVDMSGQFMIVIIVLIASPMAFIVSRQISKASARRHQLVLTRDEQDFEIKKLEQQRKLIDTKVIEGTHKRLGENQA